jgi:S-methylmethionine-dependent homocysteine/selenocysteine methylase
VSTNTEGVNVFLAETLSTTREAIAAIRATSSLGVPLWICWTIDDRLSNVDNPPTLRGGELLSDAVAAAIAAAGATPKQSTLSKLGINCAAPRAISAALPFLAEAVRAGGGMGLGMVAYGNAFKVTTSEWLAADASEPSGNGILNPAAEYDEAGVILPESYAKYAVEWVDAGVRVIGGCCGCSPEVMRVVAARLRVKFDS